MKPFSIALKPNPKQQPNLKPSQAFNADGQDSSPANRRYVTEFDPSKTLADAQSKNKLVIPPKPNEWKPHKKMKNLDLPVRSDDNDAQDHLRFEVDPITAVEPTDPNVSYGLNLRQSSKNDAESDGRPRTRSESIDSLMLKKKVRVDLESLPEVNGFDEFNDMPVEDFGPALLAGYGWYEGRGIGRNPKEDVKVVQYKRWTAKEGLGYVADVPKSNGNNSTKVVHKKEERERRSNSREEKGGGGVTYHVGKDVRIVVGRNVGLKGRIVDVMGGGDSVVLKLSRTEKEVTVRVDDVAELGSVEEANCLKKVKELKIKESKDKKCGSDGRRNKDSSRSRDEGIQDRRKYTKRSRDEETRGDRKDELRKVSWLTSHIRVRIISKELGRRLYLKKGEVVDLVGPNTCDISMDDSRELIQGVDQELLETALPHRGGPVLVLHGKHKGVYGTLVERDLENEIGVVRDADTHALHSVRLEQIAEYIGDPSYIGY